MENGTLWCWDNSVGSWVDSPLSWVDVAPLHQVRSCQVWRGWVYCTQPGASGRGRHLGSAWSCQNQGGGREAPESWGMWRSPQRRWQSRGRTNIFTFSRAQSIGREGRQGCSGQVAVRLGGQKEFDRTEHFCGARWEGRGEARWVRRRPQARLWEALSKSQAALTPLEEWL